MTLKAKTIFLFALAGTIIIAVMSVYQSISLKKEILRTVSEQISKQLEHLDFALTHFLEEVENDLLTLASDKRVGSLEDHNFTNFLNADPDTFVYRIGELEQEIIDVLNAYRMNHPYVNSVYMGRENGSFVRSHKRERPTRYDPRTRPWYILGRNNPGKVMKTDPYPSVTTKDVNIGVVTAMTKPDGSVYGVLGTDITLMNLTQYISGFRVSHGGKMYLLDDHGVILAAPNQEMLFQNVRDILPSGYTFLMETDLGDGIISTSEGPQYAYVHTSPSSGWKLVAMLPASEIQSEINGVILTNILSFSAAIILLSLCTLFGLYQYIIRPIGKLTDGTRYIKHTGDLEKRFAVNTKDEINELAVAFNEMMEALNTSQKKLTEYQEELQSERDLLEERVKQRTLELEAANRAKSMFLANMSHEIRTPLNAILGYTQLLLRDPSVLPAHRASLETVRRSGEHLLQMLNDVLEMSKIEAGRITLNGAVFDLHMLVRDLEKMFQVLTHDKGLFLETSSMDDVPRWIWTDEQKLRQVLNNLLGNAIKFTEKGGIILRVKPAAPEQTSWATTEVEGKPVRIVFEIEDTGYGIPESDCERIFSHFEQVTTGSRMKGGTGLGLAISKAYVELMGGTISVQSEVGRGSVFRFEIAAIESAEKPPETVRISRQVIGIKTEQKEIRVLVADDNETNREILVKLLQTVGFVVREAADGREACRVFETWKPHLILLDLVMPVMDGFEAIQKIRSHRDGSSIPLIAVSASVLSEDRERVLATGANEFLKKPFIEEDLFSLIKKCLNVDYLYSDETPDTSKIEGFSKSERTLSVLLPPDLVSRLQDAAISLDVERLHELMPEVAHFDTGSAEILEEWIRNYDFNTLKDQLAKLSGSIS